MRAAVREVAKHFPTAIVSGRSREKVISNRVNYIKYIYNEKYLFNM
jgi:hypothetical protein